MIHIFLQCKDSVILHSILSICKRLPSVANELRKLWLSNHMMYKIIIFAFKCQIQENDSFFLKKKEKKKTWPEHLRSSAWNYRFLLPAKFTHLGKSIPFLAVFHCPLTKNLVFFFSSRSPTTLRLRTLFQKSINGSVKGQNFTF